MDDGSWRYSQRISLCVKSTHLHVKANIVEYKPTTGASIVGNMLQVRDDGLDVRQYHLEGRAFGAVGLDTVEHELHERLRAVRRDRLEQFVSVRCELLRGPPHARLLPRDDLP